MSEKSWFLRRRDNPAFLKEHPELDPILAAVLWARHIETPTELQAYLSGESEPLADPLLMRGMPEAVERLVRARNTGEPVAVYGDFDADGVCATALLLTALLKLGFAAQAYIPDRFSEAYGLNTPALKRLYDSGIRLVVTVDCGVRSLNEVRDGNTLGLDIIITDHHSIPVELPPALAVIDPKQAECPYPFKDLSGVGIAYQLARALHIVVFGREPDDTLLELAAVGTVSDIVPLVGENRRLVQRGLEVLRNTERPGLQALMQSADITPANVNSEAIGYRMGPRINAAGRLRNAQMALDLLITTDPEQAYALARELSAVNSERQALLEAQTRLARELPGSNDSQPLLIAAHPDFHEGLVGLIAGRLCEEHYRPALVIKLGDDQARGSARSIEGLHITAALDACQDLLLRYGGHAKAAGFSLAPENLDALRERLTAHITSQVQPDTFTQRLLVDAIIPLSLVTHQSPAALRALEPVGEANPEPALASLDLRLERLRPVGSEGRHLKLEVSDGQRTLPVIAFRQGSKAASLKPGERVDLVYRPSIETWQGQETLQLVAQDIRISTNHG